MSKKYFGLNGPAGWSVNDYLKNNPFNRDIVNRKLRKIRRYISGDTYSNWYAGITNKSDDRLRAHKKNRSVDDLPKYRKFYVHSLSNAVEIEKRLHKQGLLGGNNQAGGVFKTTRYVYVFLN